MSRLKCSHNKPRIRHRRKVPAAVYTACAFLAALPPCSSMCRVSGFGDTVQRLAKQVQGALPIVGLLSRLSASGGGIGSDELVCSLLLFVCFHGSP